MGDVVYTECAVVETLKHDSSHLWSNFCIGVGQRQQGGDDRCLELHLKVTLPDLKPKRSTRVAEKFCALIFLKAGNTSFWI